MFKCTIYIISSHIKGTLEFLQHDPRFHVNQPSHDYDIFGHGGMIFWFASSIFFFMVSFLLYI